MRKRDKDAFKRVPMFCEGIYALLINKIDTSSRKMGGQLKHLKLLPMLYNCAHDLICM